MTTISKMMVPLVSLLLFLLFANFVFANTEEPAIQSEAAILIDAKTGTVLFGKNAEKRMYPASITKIVTGIVAIENADLNNNTAIVSKEARYEEGTRVFLAEGEEVTMEKLIYGLLVNSGKLQRKWTAPKKNLPIE